MRRLGQRGRIAENGPLLGNKKELQSLLPSLSERWGHLARLQRLAWCCFPFCGPLLARQVRLKKGGGAHCVFPPSLLAPSVNVTAVGVPAINGSRVILTCTLSSTMSVDNVGYIWYTVENIEDYFSSGGSSGSGQGINPELTEIQRTQNLTFSPVLFSDHGEYVCGANFGGFEMLSDPFTLYG